MERVIQYITIILIPVSCLSVCFIIIIIIINIFKAEICFTILYKKSFYCMNWETLRLSNIYISHLLTMVYTLWNTVCVFYVQDSDAALCTSTSEFTRH